MFVCWDIVGIVLLFMYLFKFLNIDNYFSLCKFLSVGNN